MVVCTSFVYVLWVHCDFDLMIFLEREVKEQEDGVVVGVDCPLDEQLLPLISTEKVHAVAKSTLSKVQIPRCRKGQSPTTLSEVDDVQSPTLSKKKKSNFGGSMTRSGVRVRGLGLVWTSAPTRSVRDQNQTRSRTRHRNLTRLVSHVLLTSLLLLIMAKASPQDGFQRKQSLSAFAQQSRRRRTTRRCVSASKTRSAGYVGGGER